MPRPVQIGVGVALVLLVGGAIYLMAVRGPVLLLDLAASAAAFLCL